MPENSHDLTSFFSENPDLDTDLGHRFVDESMIIEQLSGVVDITKYVRELRIKSDYAGDEEEKRNFSKTGEELLDGNRMYIYASGEGTSIAIITNIQGADVSSIKEAIRESGKIPVYVDNETNTIVIAINDPEEYVHHGKKANTHRDTYAGVILTRALAKANQGHVIIKDPDEVNDEGINSYDISTRMDVTFINTPKTKLTDGQLELLENLGIITLDSYVDSMKSLEREDRIKRLISLRLDIEPTVEAISKSIRGFLRNTAARAYMQEGTTGAVFTPNVFVGEWVHYGDYQGSYLALTYSYENTDTETLQTYTELLLSGESIPVSVVVYEEDSKVLLIAGCSHPDAAKYQGSFCKNGLLGFEGATVLAELDANVSIDIESLEDRTTDELSFVLKIGKVNNTGLTGERLEVLTTDDIIAKYNKSTSQASTPVRITS